LVTGIDAKAVAVTFGYVQMAVLTDDGELYTCDTGFDGYASGLGNAYKPNGEKALGRVVSDAESALAPGKVDFGSEVKIAAISTGRCHAAVATTTGAMIAFGCGKLGGGDVKGLPTKVPGRAEWRVRRGVRRVLHTGVHRGRRFVRDGATGNRGRWAWTVRRLGISRTRWRLSSG
jgi:hypothetical protein